MNFKQDSNEVIDLAEVMLKSIENADERIKALEENKGAKDVTGIKAINGSGQSKSNDYKLKQWAESGVQKYSEFAKGLPLDGNAALYEAELNTDVLEQAIVNNAMLSAIGSRGTENLDYRRTVLTVRPDVQLTAENVGFAAVSETTAADYASIAGRYTKAFAFPRLTNEVLSQSDVAVQSNLLKLLAEQFEITMQEQILHGDGTGSGTKADPNKLRGITNAAIDRANAYLEAVKPAATRDRETFAAVKANAADIGTSATELEAFLYSLMLTVPERSQATAQFAMNQNTLSFVMQTLKGSDGHSLVKINSIQENGIWVRRLSLFGCTIILNETIDDIAAGNAPIIFGDFKAAYELLRPSNGGSNSIIDPYTIPDTVGFYLDHIFGSVVADHEALAVLVCVA
ncbi:phage major capsid protein [Vibrio lentus]|uniref:phage major capsid protein n=1 Tax=Vibrio lentus TaxID=136468 RepID=UPI001F53B51A|nr:phage major capsid protein [Vibrio lentus]